ncbi:MAG: c-type cytochrome [Bacteroidia bacterium]|nr:c-type cytochrome [Bacteroidia bacterium]
MEKSTKNNNPSSYDKWVAYYILGLLLLLVVLILLFSIFLFVQIYKPDFHTQKREKKENRDSSFSQWAEAQKIKKEMNKFWVAESILDCKDSVLQKQLLYGKELITHTSKYLGPRGSVLRITNGMNCQNCHLEAGTKAFGNNYGSVFSTYPKYRARSGKTEDIFKRINDCLERSLNGKSLPVENKEMQAMAAYIQYIGKNVPSGTKAKGSGIFDLPFPDSVLKPENGKIIYLTKCKSCHQENGEGQLTEDKTAYIYPPLWGKNAYNSGAGLFRVSRFAGFVRFNMPLGATFQNPLLSEQEAWDLAAFVNSQPRPSKDLSKDWPKIEEKPADHPFGPFADSFPEKQHKLGPFKPITDAKSKKKPK